MKIKKITISLLILLIGLLGISPALASADSKSAITCGVNAAAGVNSCTAEPTNTLDGTIKTIINVMSVAVGVVAVIMIIVGGFRYVTSGGKQESVTSAKNTIVYAVIGLVIVALAQVIVRFVLHDATAPPPKTSSSNSSSNSGGNFCPPTATAC